MTQLNVEWDFGGICLLFPIEQANSNEMREKVNYSLNMMIFSTEKPMFLIPGERVHTHTHTLTTEKTQNIAALRTRQLTELLLKPETVQMWMCKCGSVCTAVLSELGSSRVGFFLPIGL